MQEYLNERWMKVEGFEHYEVSDYGRVRSHPRPEAPNHQQGIVMLRPNSAVYSQVTLCEGGELFYKMVHKLVAQHFVGPTTNEKPHVNHIDGNKKNNHYTNLEWANRSENMQHARNLGLHKVRGEQNNKAKLTAEQVLVVRKLLQDKKLTRRAIAELYDVHKSTVDRIASGKGWSHLWS